MAEHYFTLSRSEQREALLQAASASGRPAQLLEKDIWVVRSLDILFSLDLGKHLVFKGGTALSKVYRAIERFSEDIDLTYDIYQLAPDLVGQQNSIDPLPASRSQEKRWSDAIRKERLPGWVAKEALPFVTASFASVEDISVSAEDCNLFIEYKPLLEASSYVLPRVKLEFGARSSGEPSQKSSVVCDAAPYVEGVEFPQASPRVMLPSRIFWEKATAAHVYCLQGEHGISHRFSRHFSDLIRMQDAGLATSAIQDKPTAQAVATHKGWFFSEKDASGQRIDYNHAIQGELVLAPTEEARTALQEDYESMIEEGLFFDEPLPFSELMTRCNDLAHEINARMKP